MISTRECYEEAARSTAEGRLSCCSPCAPEYFGAAAYPADVLRSLPPEVVQSAMGCGDPTAVAELRTGEVVVDLGCGTGLDILLAAQRVGPSGRAMGVDMTPGLITLARKYARQAAVANAEFCVGAIEDVPLPDDCADVVISNGTVSLSADKATVFRETLRLLRPDGRLIITEFILRDGLDDGERAQASRDTGCLAGTLCASEFKAQLVEIGFDRADVRLDHHIAPGMHLGVITASAPSAEQHRTPTHPPYTAP